MLGLSECKHRLVAARSRRAWIVAVTCAAVALSLGSPARAVNLLGGLGGPAGFGPGNLPANDDGSTSSIDVSGAFPSGLRFFGMSFTSLFLNNNGNISFGGSNGTYTPQAFPVSNLRMIAPWWGDVDTRNPAFFPPSQNAVYWSIERGRFVATWHNVGYYSEHNDLENDFQMILTAAGPGVGDFDVEFRYHQCQWTTGDASGGSGGFGGTPAQAGFDAGDSVHYVSLPGSLTRSILNLCTTSNVAIPGVWRFSIRSGEVMCPGMGTACTTARPGVCAPGTVTCMGTTPVCVENVNPSPEVCDGLDNDCDGVVDNGVPPRACYTGPVATRHVGACHDGTQSCVGGSYAACTNEVLPRPEVCNNIDDDCNGIVDDGLGSTSCGEGTCRRTVPNCDHGVTQTCVPGEPDGSVGCIPQDAGNDDIGNDDVNALDIVTPADAQEGTDVTETTDGACHDYHCDPALRLQGRAGPIGCAVRVDAPMDVHGARSAIAIALGVALARLRRRRRTDPNPPTRDALPPP